MYKQGLPGVTAGKMTIELVPEKPKKRSMARKTTLEPTRVWEFGCLPPTRGLEIFEKQCQLQHRLFNTRVGIERKRRLYIITEKAKLDDYGHVQAIVDNIYFDKEAVRKAIKIKRAGVGRRADVADEVAMMKTLEDALGPAKKEKAALSEKLRDDPRMVAIYEISNATAKEEARKADAESGVYSGSKQRVVASVRQACTPPENAFEENGKPPPPWHLRPSYKKVYTGEGLCANQMSGGALSLSEAFSGEELSVQIAPVPEDTYNLPRSQRERASRTKVRVRIATFAKTVTNKDGEQIIRKEPGWVELPTILHRQIPKDARITWVWVQREKIGIDWRWRFGITFESATFFRPAVAPGTGTVAVNLGWRKHENGSIRVAYWRDDSGNHGEVLVPEKVVPALQKTDEIQGIRDTNFDSLKEVLLAGHRSPWLRARTVALDKWRSPSRMVEVLSAWGSNLTDEDRANSDVVMKWAASNKKVWKNDSLPDGGPAPRNAFEAVRAWVDNDRHLIRWVAFQRDGTLRFRREQYRIWATQLSKKYAEILVDDMYLPKFLKEKKTEDGVPSDGKAQRTTAKVAAPGSLREALVLAAGKRCVLREMNTAGMTQQCHACGSTKPWNAKPKTMHTCVDCGASWDQDENHCENMLSYTGPIPMDALHSQWRDKPGTDPDGYQEMDDGEGERDGDEAPPEERSQDVAV